MKIHNKDRMHFCHDILMVHNREKNEKRLNYCIEKWHKSVPYDISRNESTYPTVCLLLYTSYYTDHCITVCGKCIFGSNLKVALPLKQDYLNYICPDNDTDENKFIGVLHSIRAVPPEVFQIRLNIK